jgi:drug/metabolite transporter (DMT)-like permease
VNGVLLALLASGAWGLSDFLGGLRTRTVALPVVLLGSQLAGLAVLAVALGTVPSAGGALTRLAGAPLLAAAVAGAAGVTALGLLYLTMARSGTATVAPISAGAAAVPVLTGLLRGEGLTGRTGAGIALALAGAVLAAGGSPGRAGAGRDVLAIAAGAGSALAGGTFFVLIRIATDGAGPLAATLAARVAGCALVAAWALGRWPDLRGVGAVGRWGLAGLAAVGGSDALAEVCFAGAATRAPQGVTAALSSLYPAVAVLLALVLLRERLGRRSVAGIGCALVGVVLLGDA